MPPIIFSTSKRCALLTTSISFKGEIISPYSYYAKKGLVYIIITFFFSCQPSSYFKYIKANTCLLYNMRSVSFNKYRYLRYAYYYIY